MAFVRWPERVQPLQVEGLEAYLHAYVESRMGEGVKWELCVGKCYTSLKTWQMLSEFQLILLSLLFL